jgi:hypothetical protein
MARFRKKPVVIEAFQFTGPWAGTGIPDWYTEAFQKNLIIHYGERKTDYAQIITPGGAARADKGDWIIRGVKGEIYPCKADAFAATHEAVE